MKLAEIVRADGSRSVRLPDEFRLEGDTVSIRRQGEAIVLEPLSPATLPPGFFDRIRIDDPAFARPSQRPVMADADRGRTLQDRAGPLIH